MVRVEEERESWLPVTARAPAFLVERFKSARDLDEKGEKRRRKK